MANTWPTRPQYHVSTIPETTAGLISRQLPSRFQSGECCKENDDAYVQKKNNQTNKEKQKQTTNKTT